MEDIFYPPKGRKEQTPLRGFTPLGAVDGWQNPPHPGGAAGLQAVAAQARLLP